MANEIKDILKSSETFDEFYKQADQYIEEELKADENWDVVMEEQIKDRALEYWNEFINETLPF